MMNHPDTETASTDADAATLADLADANAALRARLATLMAAGAPVAAVV